MKAFFLMILFPLVLKAATWDDYLAEKRLNVSDERHLPYQLSHGHKTAVSVLLIHGIYSSPLYFKGMAEAYFKAGYNVVTILLPGHWEKDFYSISKITEDAWIKEADRGFELAKELGDKVLLSGHSLGGLLSVEQANKRQPDEVAGLVVVSPAFKVWEALHLACKIGTGLHISGNQFYRKLPDGKDVPYFAPFGALLVQRLANKVDARKISAPLFLAYTWNDIEVNIPYVNKTYEFLPGVKEKFVFGLTSGISHGAISQAPTDLATYGNRTNPRFNEMMNAAIEFLRRL
jgi:pimeloyl-ACP methyl ester carboxylesterase